MILYGWRGKKRGLEKGQMRGIGSSVTSCSQRLTESAILCGFQFVIVERGGYDFFYFIQT